MLELVFNLSFELLVSNKMALLFFPLLPEALPEDRFLLCLSFPDEPIKFTSVFFAFRYQIINPTTPAIATNNTIMIPTTAPVFIYSLQTSFFRAYPLKQFSQRVPISKPTLHVHILIYCSFIVHVPCPAHITPLTGQSLREQL